MRKFKLEYVGYFPNLLEYCLKADGVSGGTIHQYISRLSVGGPAKYHRYGMRPIIQVYLDGKPLERAWFNNYMADLDKYIARSRNMGE